MHESTSAKVGEQKGFEGWAIVELMGHRRLAGYVLDAQIGGATFIRIDVPTTDTDGAATQFYAPAAVYCITPTTEEMAIKVAVRDRPRPVEPWELPSMKAGETEDDEPPY